MQNQYLLANIAFDPAENKPWQVHSMIGLVLALIWNCFWPRRTLAQASEPLQASASDQQGLRVQKANEDWR